MHQFQDKNQRDLILNFCSCFLIIGVVDIGYSASSPMKFYSQEIGSQFDYYHLITQSAERSVKGTVVWV